MTGAAAPLVELRDVTLASGLRLGTLSISASSVVCLGQATALVPTLVEPRGLRRGSIALQRQEPQRGFRNGRFGYCPAQLQVAPQSRVLDVLTKSAKLLGAGRKLAQTAIAASGLWPKRNGAVGGLADFEMRLLGISHGLLSSPEIMMVEDLFQGLTDQAAEIVHQTLQVALAERVWIMALSEATSWGRDWLYQAEAALRDDRLVQGRQLQEHALKQASCYWVASQDSSERLGAELSRRGHRYGRSAHDEWLLAATTSSEIMDCAESCGALVLELIPAQDDPFNLACVPKVR